jgi:hypothetical protein
MAKRKSQQRQWHGTPSEYHTANVCQASGCRSTSSMSDSGTPEASVPLNGAPRVFACLLVDTAVLEDEWIEELLSVSSPPVAHNSTVLTRSPIPTSGSAATTAVSLMSCDGQSSQGRRLELALTSSPFGRLGAWASAMSHVYKLHVTTNVTNSSLLSGNA